MKLKGRVPGSRTFPINVPKSIFQAIEKMNLGHAFVFIVTSFGLGQAANSYSPMDKFLVYQLLFIPAIVIALAEIKAFVHSADKYKTMVASHPTRETGTYIIQLLRSYAAVPGLIAIGSLYLYSTISLKYVPINLTGFYALLMITLVMLSAILGQTCYVYYLLLLRKVSTCEKFEYNFYFPARTNWVQLLAGTGARLSNAFFVLGFIYTTVFFLNMPAGYLQISLRPWSLTISTPNDPAFVMSWLAIFIIIIIAFPMYAWTRARLLKNIIRRLKDISITEIQTLITESKIRREGNVDAELKYYQLMVSIENSSSEASDTRNLLPAALTISSIAVHLIKISESFSP